MNAIEVLAQQQADEILQLETAYANLYHAYERGNRDEIISAYSAAEAIIGLHNRILNETKRILRSKGITPDIRPCSISLIYDDVILRSNIEGCLNVLLAELQSRHFYRSNNTYAQRMLYRPNHTFVKMKFCMSPIPDNSRSLICLPLLSTQSVSPKQ